MIINKFLFLIQYTEKKTKYKLVIILILMLLVSVTEVISLSAVLPYLSALNDPDKTKMYLEKYISIRLLNENFFLKLTIIFSLLIIIAVTLRLFLLYLSTTISFEIGSQLSSKIYLTVLNSEYEDHVNKNSSEILDMITRKTNELTNYINSFLNIIASSIIITSIGIVIIYINYKITIILFLSFSIIYFSISLFTKRMLSKNSYDISKYGSKTIQAIQNGLGSMRDIILENNQEYYKQIYSRYEIKLRFAQAQNNIIGTCPRFILEALGMVIIVCVSYVLFENNKNIISTLPIMGIIVLGSQKLLPLFQSIYSNWAILRAATESFNECKNYLIKYKSNQDIKPENLNIFENFKMAEFCNVSFKYSTSNKYIFNKLNLKIFRGDKIAIIGKSGAGKSTIIDLLMGLLTPTSGYLIIDNKKYENFSKESWRKNIAHVPQNIYISDSTVLENIAFGLDLEDIDVVKVKKCAIMANISEYIDSLPNKYNTILGENGAKLSGGQKQRIGIARALYKKADILIFDEATSALDVETELSIIDTLNGLDKDLTLIIVTHRPTLTQFCNKIWVVGNSAVQENIKN